MTAVFVVLVIPAMRLRSPHIILFCLFIWGQAHLISQDFDGDGLTDQEERLLNTNPRHADTDRDGLLDGWEVYGFDADGDGQIDEPLAACGANPLIKDVFVEIDWMRGPGGENSIAPSILSLVEHIGALFQDNGMQIHFDVGPIGISSLYSNRFAANGSGGSKIDFQPVFLHRPWMGRHKQGYSLYRMAQDPYFFRKSRRLIFYYFFVAHQCSFEKMCIAHVDGFDDFPGIMGGLSHTGLYSGLLYNNAFNKPYQLTAAFLHELGHCLGLGHGGVSSTGCWLNEPEFLNYVSVMNPLYMLSGIDFQENRIVLDFSHGQMPSILENSLDERTGLGPGMSLFLLQILGFNRLPSERYPWNIDWNKNGIIDNFRYALDINRDGEVAEKPWHDFDDWQWLTTQTFKGVGGANGPNNPDGTNGAISDYLPAMDLNWLDRSGNGVKECYVLHGNRLQGYAMTPEGPAMMENKPLPAPWLRWSMRFTPYRNGNAGGQGIFLQTREGWFMSHADNLPFVSFQEAAPDHVDMLDITGGGDINFGISGHGTIPFMVTQTDQIASIVSLTSEEVLPVMDIPLQAGALDNGENGFIRMMLADTNGDGWDDILTVYPRMLQIWSIRWGVPEMLSMFEEVIETPDALWRLSSLDRYYMTDVNGDAIQDLVICRWPEVGIFLNGRQQFAVHGQVIEFSDSKDADEPLGMRTGNYLQGPGTEILITHGNNVHLLMWREGKMRVINVTGSVLAGRFGENISQKRPLLNIGNNGLDTLVSLTSQSVEQLNLAENALQRYPVNLKTRDLWPVQAIESGDINQDGVDDLFVASGRRLGCILSGVGGYRLAWVYAWHDADGVFEMIFRESPPLPTERFLRGDSNADNQIDLSDALYVLIYLFGNVSNFNCLDSGDANDDGMVDLADAIYILTYLFNRGPEPPYPGPHVPGLDVSEDALPPCLRLAPAPG